MPRKPISQLISVELLNRVLLNDHLCQSIFMDWCNLRMSDMCDKLNEINCLNML